LNDASSADAIVNGAESIHVGGAAIELVRKGEGAPLLYLHGMDGVEAAAEMIEALAGSFAVYAPSHPGFGGSELPRGVTTADDLGYFYLDLMEERGLRDVTVVGLSIGGWIAAEMLVKDDSRVARAVLGAPLGLSTGDGRKQRVPDIFMLPAAEIDARLQETPAAPRPAPADLTADTLERQVRNADAVSLFGWSPYLHNPKLRQRLHRIKAPVLLLWGEKDALVPRDYMEDFAGALGDARLQVLPDCGHRIHVDSPAPAAEAITAFAAASADKA